MATEAAAEDMQGEELLRYAELQYVFVQFLSEHLTDCRSTFDGDLDSVLVLAVLGQSHLRAVLAATDHVGDNPAMTASRLADVTGIPRETVRRKLRLFQESGWIQKGADGAWSLCGTLTETPARRDLSGLNNRGIGRLMSLNSDVTRILRRRDNGAQG